VESPWYSIGGLQAIMRERRIVIQDSEGHDVLRLGLGADSLWALVLVDTNGQERVRIGQTSSTQFGMRTKSASGQTVFEVDNAGQSLPYLNLPMGQRGGIAGIGIQNVAYGGDGSSDVDFYAVAQRVRLTWGLSYLSGTYAVRVKCLVGVTTTVLHETVDIVAAASKTVDVELPGGSLGQDVRLTVEAKRTAGAELAGLQIILHPINYS